MSRPELRNESVGELVKELGRGTTEILRKEVQLARAEVVESVDRAKRGIVWLVLAMAPVLMVMVLVPMAIVSALDAFMLRWVAAAITAVVMLAIAGVLAAIAVKKLKNVDPKPDRAIEDVKEEKEWLTNRLRSSVRSTKSATT